MFFHILQEHEKIEYIKYEKYDVDLKNKVFLKLREKMNIDNKEFYPFHKILRTFKFEKDEKGWKEILFQPFYSEKSLKIATFNVLFDLYDKDKIFTKERIPMIMDMLSSLNIDIICLQEVTCSFLKILLEEKWVKENYYVSDVKGKTVKPYGQFILSKIPFCLEVYQFSPHKGFIIGEFKINDKSIQIPVIHLTSPKAEDSEKKRLEQIQKILEFCKLENIIITGDFNFGDELEIDEFKSFIDVWKYLKPNHSGYTFDPENNDIAKALALFGISRRLDRILIQSNSIKIEDVILFGNDEIYKKKKIFPSDHYGVMTTIFIEKENK